MYPCGSIGKPGNIKEIDQSKTRGHDKKFKRTITRTTGVVRRKEKENRMGKHLNCMN